MSELGAQASSEVLGWQSCGQTPLSHGTHDHDDSEESGMLLCPKGVTFPSSAENRDCLNHGERGGLEQLQWKTE